MIMWALKWLLIIGVVLTVIYHPARADAAVHRGVAKIEQAASGVSAFALGL